MVSRELKGDVSRVVRDPRDAEKDIWVETALCEVLFDRGKLGKLVENDTYATNERTPPLQCEGRYA